MALDRRLFLKSVGLLGGASVLGSSTASAAELVLQESKDEFGFAALPYLQNLTVDTVTVCCVMNKPALAWIELLNADGSVASTIYELEDGMRNANAELFKFKVPHAGKDFSYRVVAKEVLRFDPYKIEYGKEAKSEPVTTVLPIHNKQDCQVLILNDVHEDVSSFATLYNLSTLPRKDLVILNGDTFHHVTRQGELTDRLLNPISKLFASKTPFVMNRGNHETRGSFARHYKPYFDYPNNKFYYAFTQGPVFFIMLDGGEDKPDDHEVYGGTVDYDAYRLEQREWLKQVIKSKERKKAKYTVVVNHIPFFHSDSWHGTLHNRSSFHDIMQAAKVDALISGHTHKYGSYAPDADHNYHIFIGGGYKKGERTIVEVSATNAKLDIKLKKDNGEEIGSLVRS